jgi:GT2 family glycosyltransferase
MKKLSVIIVNYNVEHFLKQCLTSVYQALANLEAEVFVVDNNSVDGSLNMIQRKFPQVHLIANKENVGFAKANNQAIKIAQGEYVLLLNPDTVVENDTFDKIIQFMENTADAGALGVKMVNGKENPPESKRGLPLPSVAFSKFRIVQIISEFDKIRSYHLTYLITIKFIPLKFLTGHLS